MNQRLEKRERGFSLLEMTIAMALGTLVVGAAVQLYSQAVAGTFLVSQRVDLQQNFRAAANMITRDLSLAGAGLGTGANIQLPTSATLPRYGCAQVTGLPCYLGTSNTTGASYPTQGGTPFLYGLLPGYNAGPTINTQTTDIVTVAYTDNSFYLDCYPLTLTSATTVTFAAASAASTSCTASGATIQNVNDASVGLTTGDLVLFSFTGGAQIVAEVNGSVTATTATFATGDALRMNQGSSVPKSLASIAAGTTGSATRIFVITYYIDNTVSPSRLMRQVNGHSPMPVVDGITYLKFNYNLFNAATGSPAVNCSNPGAASDGCSGASTGLYPNSITSINIQHMAMNSTLQGSQYGQGKGYQGLDLQTSVCARDLTYANNYPN